MKRIAIIGGGISGLAAAFALEQSRRAGAAIQYELFESGSRLGGVLRTERVDGCLVEAGPDSFLSEKTWAADFCRDLGIGDQLIGSNDSVRKTYILRNGRLVAVPEGLMFMVPTKILPLVASPLFSLSTKLRMAGEWFYAARKSESDESVAALVERHYGREMIDRLVDPLLCGIYGGDASQLSVRVVLPRFAEMEASSGSLGKGMLAARRRSPGGVPKPLFTTLKDGMQQISDAIVAKLFPASLRCGVAVDAVLPGAEGWTVAARNQELSFDAVIMAVPAQRAAEILQSTSPDLSSELHGIKYSSSVTVALGYGREVRAGLPAGFGFLVPRSEGKRLMAATFVHNKFDHRTPEDRALVRCFLGGSQDAPVLDLSEPEIVRLVRDELKQVLGITAEPWFSRLYKWREAMAQYNVGHLERLQRIEELRQEFPTLALAGNAYRGIGVPDCIRSGREAALQIMGVLGARPVTA